ncbi:MAG: hypothetical protein EOS36_09470 [Mesorhizobium sp.]|uniref:hypothetical protein n=1 Tax=Mesorhizobium sp. TaxID=1871066 RepID=UPI000FE57439|nr:hypothetical protein [Mesorhizobium sp.]RWD64640.1 MAG: hypothetical protein EOS36_09470 [Mesorhizobium sp.]RWE42141.1 MAG: hypothetical protein EOS79_16810 [Mesorhizobium sp.]
MGFSISWFGLRGYGIKEAAALFGREIGGTSEDFDAPVNAYGSDKNWAIIILGYCSFPNPPDSYLSAFSQGREMVVVHIEEQTMFARAELWSSGKNIWRVSHSGDKDVRDIHTTGDLPASFESLRQQAFSKQDKESDVDYVFDIPLDLAAELTGFRHDEGAPDRVFFELVEKPAQQ